jgi:hypothetical protein
MQGILNERAMLYELIENIKMNNPEEQTSKAMKILKTLLTNIQNNPQELKFRIIKTTNPNINNSLMNIKGICDLLYALGYTSKYDGNFMLETSDLNNLNLCLNILNTDINQFNQKEYVKETSKLMMKNPEVAKEMEAKRRKLEEEKRQKERVKEMIEADKIERRERFKYK